VETDETRAARDGVTASLAQVEAGQRDALEDLRIALCTYVGVLRRLGLTRDDVLAHVREIVREPATPGGAFSLTPIVREALAELTLEWCRAEYARIAPA
jgi:hypothetical protein